MLRGHWVSLAAFICQNWTLVRATVYPAKASRGRRLISVGNGLVVVFGSLPFYLLCL